MPFAQLPGVNLHYIERGQGPALVLLHGFPLDCRVWEAQVAALSDKCRVIAPDLRGFGQSVSTDAFTLETLADDVHHFVHKIGATPAVLGGLSMGGYVALYYLRKYPGDLAGLIFVDTKAEADTSEGKANRLKMAEAARTQGSAVTAGQMMPKILAPQALESRPDLVSRLRQIMEGCPALTIEHALLAMREREDMSCELPSTACPALVIVGEADALIPVSTAEAMARQMRHSRLAVIKNAGHMTPMEQPDAVNQAMREFMESSAMPGRCD